MQEDIKEAAVTEEKKKPKKSTIITAGAIALALCGGFYLYSSQFQSTDDAYVEAHLVQVSAKVDGEIVECNITDNQNVKKGYVTAKIDDTDYKIALAHAQANYEKALSAQHIANAGLIAANTEIELAKKDLERYQNLYATGAVSKQVLDNAQVRYDSVRAKREHAEQQLFSKSKNNVADADLKALKALRDKAELNLSYTNITVPRDGKITGKKIEQGVFVRRGQPLFAVVPDEVWVVANFKENQISNMKVGQKVDIKIDAYPNKTFKGKIDSIQASSGAKASLFPPENAVGSFVKIVQRVPVKIVFDEEIDKSKYNIVAGLSVVPKVKVK